MPNLTFHKWFPGRSLKPLVAFIITTVFAASLVSPAICLATTAQQPVLVLNTTGNPPLNTADQTGFVDLVITEAFHRIGVIIQSVKLPAERGLLNANQGIEDGEMLRISGLSKIYTNLIMVPEKIMDGRFVGFSKKSIDLSAGWNALTDYSVVFVNGWKIMERNVPPKTNIVKVRSADLLFPMLELDRADIALYEEWGGLYLLAKTHSKKIKELKPPLASRKLYMYLNKKHQALVPLVTHVLKQMKADGSYQALVDRILTPLKSRQ